MKSIEDRLRDTFRADAETVRPGTLRGLPERRTRPARRAARYHAWRQAAIPLAAAAAVVVILLGAAVAVPRLFPGHGSTPTIASGPLPPFYLGTRDGAELEVNNAATGQIVTQVPQPRKGAVLWIATATGRLTFLVAFVNRQEQQKCTGQLWLYRLRLTPAGQPLPMSLVATTALHGLLTSMSRDGQVLALTANGCNGKPATTLTVLNRSTQQVRHWTGPKPHEVASLSGDGSVLVYAAGSGVAVLPASAPDGSLARRSRIVAPNREFGPGTVASHPRLAPNNTLYFATHQGSNGWQLRAYNLTTGRTRLLKDLPGSPLGIVSDPSGRYLLLRYGLNKVPPGHAGAPAARLVRLDTTTGKITRLAAHAEGMDQFTGEAVLAW